MIIAPISAWAGSEDLCPTVPFERKTPLIRDDNLIELTGDDAQVENFDRYRFSGNVQLLYRSKLLTADSLVYEHGAATVQADGDIYYQQEGLFLRGKTANFVLNANSGKIKSASYYFEEQHAIGEAAEIEFENRNSHLTQSSYSTCFDSPKAWELRAGDIRLNPDENEGVARDVSLRVYSVPVAYLPYISFPLGGRKSGFLTPKYSNSSVSGFGLAAPYYVNIAPNFDATVTPKFMTQRGLLLQNEFRYLLPNDRGDLFADVLPDDRVRNQRRAAISYTHTGAAGRHFTYSADINHVSDDAYLRELGGSIDAVSLSYVPREVRTTWYDDRWQFGVSVQDYQLINPELNPTYRRLPQAHYLYRRHQQWVGVEVESEYTYFQRRAGDNGHRAWLEPRFVMPLRSSNAELTPRLAFRHTEYSVATASGVSNERSAVDIADWSVVGRVFLERLDDNSGQTLTPFLSHNYVPYIAQEQLPLFDTARTDFRLSQLVGSRRYDGNDRVGDTHNISAGIRWAWYQRESTSALASVTLVNAYAVADQRIRLPEESAVNAGDVRSVAQFDAYLSQNLSSNGRLFYNWQSAQAEKGIIQLHYDADQGGVNLSYRFRQPQIEQISAAAYFDLQSRWRLNTRVSYSLRENRFQEADLGTEYGSCCYTLRFVAQAYIDSRTNTYNTATLVQVELKGLASFGDSIDKLFSQEFITKRYRYDVFQ